ncbi:MAG: chemoreceptor glutamine deamidase CheD [Gammaproteobacteria bacterium]
MPLKLNHRDIDLANVLEGFEHINRYWDKRHNMVAAKITPGQYYVTGSEETIVTVLGSCISACIRDPIAGVGGMNHFMLPVSNGGNGDDTNAAIPGNAARYGNYAMEHMINDILKHGGQRRHLEVKICGGGRVLKNMKMIDIGRKNIDFVRDYLKTEGLTLLAEDVGDIYPRKVQYTPATGTMKIKRLRSMHNDTIVQREITYRHEIERQPVGGEVELF